MNEKCKQPQQIGEENLMLVLSIPNFIFVGKMTVLSVGVTEVHIATNDEVRCV